MKEIIFHLCRINIRNGSWIFLGKPIINISFNANAIWTECTRYFSVRDKNSIAASNCPVNANTWKYKCFWSDALKYFSPYSSKILICKSDNVNPSDVLSFVRNNDNWIHKKSSVVFATLGCCSLGSQPVITQ